MERTEPTFVPEWLKSSGGLSTTSHQFTSSSFPSDEQRVSKSLRNKSLDSNLGRSSGSDRTTSSYLRRPSISNGSASLRSYSSFNKNNHRDRDRDNKDIYNLRNKEKSGNRHQDYIDPLGNIFPSRFEKDGLRRSHSSLSGKRGDSSSWPRKVASDFTLANKSSHNNGPISSVKTSFEKDFPSLGQDEKHADSDIGRVPSPGLSSAIQSLPIGSSALIGGDGWTSALAEVPVIVGSNGNSTSVAQPVQPTSVSTTIGITGGRNMAETLAHGPPRTQAAPQVDVGAQRLEELAVKQSRQLIPMTPSLPKTLALNSSDKPKLKVGQSQIQSSHLANYPHTPRPAGVKPEVSKPSTVGNFLVLKPSREKNGISPTPKESLSPPASSKLPNSPLAVPSVIGPTPLTKPIIPTLEKKPSLQAQSRTNFFNLMRKKSMVCNSSVTPETGSSGSPSEPAAHVFQGGSGEPVMNVPSETKVELACNGDACAETMMISSSTNSNGKKNGPGPDAILCSEEEEARFLRSLGWEETAEEEEGLTEEEISAFYQNYMSLKPDSKFSKGTEPKVVMPIGEISLNSKVDS
ncbi:uncharacterized protein [Rutidosis leptorrhynchoides]|uniref:uncharacterized protein n=1 Tax=Rutidosis leptorrhynchoides TaxID=125765 RepID=UPI003A99041F